MENQIPKMAQGPAKQATVDDTVRDTAGFTNPNLHRRILTPPDGTPDHTYKIGVYGYDSYRMTETFVHDEESRTCEIP